MDETLLQKLKRLDAGRRNLPGEHWLAFTAGVGLWIATRRHPAVAVRLLGSLVGTVLVARAATGREVPAALQRLPFASRAPSRGDWIG